MKTATDLRFITVTASGADLEAVRELFLEYATSLGFGLCFQGFDKELAGLPGEYAVPRGCLLMAKNGNQITGCVGVRPLDAAHCEMKRLYVRPDHRGMGLGRKLAGAALAAARGAGYRKMYLDTLPSMTQARALYASLGFIACAPYYDNSCAGSDCFELKL